VGHDTDSPAPPGESRHPPALEDPFRTILAIVADHAYALRLHEDGSFSLEWASEALAELTGLSPQKSGEEAWMLLVHPDDRTRVLGQFLAIVARHAADLVEHRILTRTGEERWLRCRCWAIGGTDTPVHLYAAAQDVTETRQVEQALRFLTEVAAAAAQAPDASTLLSRSLEVAARLGAWPLAQAWRPDPGKTRLECTGVFASDTTPDLREPSLAAPLPRGVGLPGRAWAEAEPQWLADLTGDHDDPRLPAAQKIGLTSGLALPVMAGGDVLAVLEFFSTRRRALPATLIAAAKRLGAHLGVVLSRRQAEAALVERQSRLGILHVISQARLAGLTADEVIHKAVAAIAASLPGLRATHLTLDSHNRVSVGFAAPPRAEPDPPGLGVALLGTEEPGDFPGAAPFVCEDAQSDPRLARVHERLSVHGVGALLVAALRQRERTVGWLTLDGPTPRRFGSHEVETITEAAEHLSVALAEEQTRRERERAEEERRRTEDVYRTVVETSPDAILLLDLHATIVLCNQQAARMYGCPSPSMLQGRYVLDFLVPQERERARANLESALSLGALWGAEYTLSRQDGSTFPAEVSASVVADVTGRPEGLILDVRDVTERHRVAEEQSELHAALRKSALEWRRTFDAIESPVLILNPEGIVARLNRAAQALAGRSFQEIVRRPLHELGDAQPWSAVGRLAEKVFREHAPASAQIEDPARGRTWDLTASVTGAAEGLPERAIVVARDITAIVELQASLRRNETMSALGSIVAGVAHEVRNPLHVMSATLDVFEARFGAREEFARYLHMLRSELDRLTRLMQDLLAYGRPTTAAERPPVALAEVVGEALPGLTLLAKRQNVDLKNLVADDLPAVPVDRSRILDVLRNLIENAVQHAPTGTTVTIEARRIDDGDRTRIECRVSDEGPGFGAEDLGRVFEPFFTRRRGGTGLGLSIVQRIVEQHGGSVRAENREGGGGVVVFDLPIVCSVSFTNGTGIV
jgi:PAS domain S-box-containing protein